MKWTIGRRLQLLTVMTLLNIGGLGAISLVYISQLSFSIEVLGKNNFPAVQNMTLADMMHDGIRAVAYRSIIASDAKDEKEYAEIHEEFNEFSEKILFHLNEIQKLNLDPKIKEKSTQAIAEVSNYVASAGEIVELSLSGKKEQAIEKVPELQKSFSILEESLGKLGGDIEEYSQSEMKDAIESAQVSKNHIYLIIFLSFVVGLFVSWMMSKQLVKLMEAILLRLLDETQHLGKSSNEVQDSATQLSENAQNQAEAVQETAASLEEINSMVAKTSENSARLSQSTTQTQEIVQEGQSAVTEMFEAVKGISDANSNISRQIEESNSRIAEIVNVISEIGQKTKVINEIVFQTKLLSFNASVEAARAGENGRGFAVVAEEVGNLALMSGSSAREITEMLDSGIKKANEILHDNKQKINVILNDSQKRIQHGTETSEQCQDVLNRIVSQMNEVGIMTSEITSAISEQTTGLDHINKAMHIFDKSSQKNSSMSEHTTSVASDLTHQFETFQQVMNDLQSLVKGTHSPPEPHSEPLTPTDSHNTEAA